MLIARKINCLRCWFCSKKSLTILNTGVSKKLIARKKTLNFISAFRCISNLVLSVEIKEILKPLLFGFYAYRLNNAC